MKGGEEQARTLGLSSSRRPEGLPITGALPMRHDGPKSLGGLMGERAPTLLGKSPYAAESSRCQASTGSGIGIPGRNSLTAQNSANGELLQGVSFCSFLPRMVARRLVGLLPVCYRRYWPKKRRRDSPECRHECIRSLL